MLFKVIPHKSSCKLDKTNIPPVSFSDFGSLFDSVGRHLMVASGKSKEATTKKIESDQRIYLQSFTKQSLVNKSRAELNIKPISSFFE